MTGSQVVSTRVRQSPPGPQQPAPRDRGWRRWFSAPLRIVALALSGAIVGATLNALRSDGVAFALQEPVGTCSAPEDEPRVEQLTPDEAAERCVSGDFVVVDVRPEERFVAGHVSGAVHLPCSATTDAADAVLETLRMGKNVILYGEGNGDALLVAESLARRSDRKVAALKGGFAAWDRAGFACSSGPCDQCSTREPR